MKTAVSLIIALFLFVSPVWAHESPSSSPNVSPRAQDRVKEGIQNIKQNLREGIKEKRPERKEKTSPPPRVESKERIRKIKDENKQKIVERISKQLDELNARTTGHFVQVLDRLEKVLAKTVSRVDKAEANNWDVSGVRAIINQAKEAIASARSAVEAQKAKDYTPQISGEEAKLKVEVGEAREALHNDLTQVRQKVLAAREFVKAVAAALAQSPRINELKAPTPSQ